MAEARHAHLLNNFLNLCCGSCCITLLIVSHLPALPRPRCLWNVAYLKGEGRIKGEQQAGLLLQIGWVQRKYTDVEPSVTERRNTLLL